MRKLETLYRDCQISTDMTGLGPRTPKENPSPSLLRGPDDLVFDAAGGFWIADFGKARPRERDVTGIYYARTDGSYIREKIFPLEGPNGIALSPAGDRLYASFTFRHKLLYWELDGPGSIRPNPETMDGAHVLRAGLPGELDSIKVDEQGNVYAITVLPKKTPFCNGGVTVVSPQGEILEYFEIAIPGLDAPLQQFIRGQTEKLTIELLFDTAVQGMGVGARDVRTLTGPMYELVKIQPKTHAPPRLRLTWGHSGLSFKAIAETIDQKFVLFSPEGIPLRATLTMTFRGYATLEEQLADLKSFNDRKEGSLAPRTAPGERLHGWLLHGVRPFLHKTHWRFLRQSKGWQSRGPRERSAYLPK